MRLGRVGTISPAVVLFLEVHIAKRTFYIYVSLSTLVLACSFKPM